MEKIRKDKRKERGAEEGEEREGDVDNESWMTEAVINIEG